jgi:phosphorylcholine metabolism protein LicD
MNVSTDFFIPDLHKKILKILLEKVSKLLDENNINYFIDGGTLLGAERDKDLIPYDDDVDIGVLFKDFNKLMKILPNLKDEEYEIKIQQAGADCIKVFVGGLWCRNQNTNRVIGTPTLDIYRWEIKKDIVRLASLTHRQLYKNCFYKLNEFYPLKKYQFGELVVKGCNNPLGYLKRYYGDDCLTNYKMGEYRELNN